MGNPAETYIEIKQALNEIADGPWANILITLTGMNKLTPDYKKYESFTHLIKSKFRWLNSELDRLISTAPNEDVQMVFKIRARTKKSLQHELNKFLILEASEQVPQLWGDDPVSVLKAIFDPESTEADEIRKLVKNGSDILDICSGVTKLLKKIQFATHNLPSPEGNQL